MGNLVTIKTFFEPTELLIPRSLLESEGIECFTMDELTTQVYPVPGFGGIKLQVKEEDVEKAVKILVDGGFLMEENLKPTGLYEFIGKFLEKFRKK
ncbi:hypothetical protein FACS1894203_4980 [Bacteroidia bacterium]|nr:hypothetical protein FACS1894203_4980 [Bacteroidia bacterium]